MIKFIIWIYILKRYWQGIYIQTGASWNHAYYQQSVIQLEKKRTYTQGVVREKGDPDWANNCFPRKLIVTRIRDILRYKEKYSLDKVEKLISPKQQTEGFPWVRSYE